MTDLLMGIPGLDVVQPGTHVCALFSGPAERDSLILQFMQEGLRHGDQCVCLIDELEPSSMHEKAYEPAELGDSRRSGRFDLYSAPDAYIGGGELSRKQRISGLVSPPTSPEDNWFPVLRAAGQMSRSAYEPGAREFSAYESAVILILAQVPT
ncbi:MAG: MEDS domain-containing protein, partial [Microbacterium sp.]